MENPETHIKSVAKNRRARHEYFVIESIEVGIVLRGTEVKSIRAGKVNLQDSYATVESDELFLHNLHVSPFEKGSIHNHDPLRVRKLLARKKEIRKLGEKVNEKGLTLIPLELYFLNQHLKIELGICKGKKTYDKRQSLKKREMGREIQQQLNRDQ